MQRGTGSELVLVELRMAMLTTFIVVALLFDSLKALVPQLKVVVVFVSPRKADEVEDFFMSRRCSRLLHGLLSIFPLVCLSRTPRGTNFDGYHSAVTVS